MGSTMDHGEAQHPNLYTCILPPPVACQLEHRNPEHSLSGRLIAENQAPSWHACLRLPLDSHSQASMDCYIRRASASAQALLAVHEGEAHVLVWRGGTGAVLLHEGASPVVLLRALWQVPQVSYVRAFSG